MLGTWEPTLYTRSACKQARRSITGKGGEDVESAARRSSAAKLLPRPASVCEPRALLRPLFFLFKNRKTRLATNCSTDSYHSMFFLTNPPPQPNRVTVTLTSGCGILNFAALGLVTSEVLSQWCPLGFAVGPRVACGLGLWILRLQLGASRPGLWILGSGSWERPEA